MKSIKISPYHILIFNPCVIISPQNIESSKVFFVYVIPACSLSTVHQHMFILIWGDGDRLL